VVVKSASSIRSKVVESRVFRNWERSGLHTIPVLFQKKVEGADLRIHVLEGKAWALQVDEKSDIDYRYARKTSPMHEQPTSESTRKFCFEAMRIEDNTISGVDFIVGKDGSLTCLEVNPGPGWAWYHNPERCKESFVKHILEVLTHEGA
jgi:D-alanine-D-alanine ligase-like ATP-grasp enzyme